MSDIAHVIQLAVTPVFLLAGIGAFINAFAARLGRIFDRIRLLEALLVEAPESDRASIRAKLGALGRRAHLTYVGIALTILSALLVCVLITLAFAAYFLDFESRWLIGGLFIAAMLCLIGGLIAFLREVFYAVRGLALNRSWGARWNELP